MNYTDSQLCEALAKLLPDILSYHGGNGLVASICGSHRPVFETELLHFCWLVEETLGCSWSRYYEELIELHPNGAGVHTMTFHASWRLRVIALCKIKGIEIV